MLGLVFIDDLALELVTLPIVSLLILYVTGRAYMARRSGDLTELKGVLREGGVPLFAFGLLITSLAFFGEMTWTLPGSYNILFSDAYALLGLILVAFGASLIYGKGVSTAGVLALGAGFFVAWYGVNAYWLGMTKEPIALLGIYGLWGLAAIASFPMTMVMDRWMKLGQAKDVVEGHGMTQGIPQMVRAVGTQGIGLSVGVTKGWLLRNQLWVMAIFWVLLIAAGLVSGYVGFSTIPAHLASAP